MMRARACALVWGTRPVLARISDLNAVFGHGIEIVARLSVFLPPLCAVRRQHGRRRFRLSRCQAAKPPSRLQASEKPISRMAGWLYEVPS